MKTEGAGERHEPVPNDAAASTDAFAAKVVEANLPRIVGIVVPQSSEVLPVTVDASGR